MQTLGLTSRESYEALLARGWTELDAAKNLVELAALSASNGKRVIVLDQNEIYTLDTSSSAASDGLRVVARTNGQPGRWLLFVPEFDLLWVCQQLLDLKLFAFTSSQAAASPSSAPHITLTLPEIGPADGHRHRVSSFGFAPNGDIWVGYADIEGSPSQGQYLAKFSASKLLATATIVADFSFPLPTATAASSIGFSAIVVRSNGDLWTSTIATTTRSAGIFGYSAASIASPGSPSPAVILAQPFPPVPDNPTHSNAANDLCFDAAGNLWFCNAVARTINRLSASQLLATNTAIVPDVVLSTPGLTYTGCILDPDGNLWCARSSVGRVDMFAAADIAASGSPSPARSITSSASTPLGKVRFDKSGDLWTLIGNSPSGYASASIVVSGSPPPGAVLTGGGALSSPRVINFNPASFA
jgi:hypothetical protein